MKILILTDGIYPFVIGGMQKHSFYLTKMLVELGESVTLIHCVQSGKSLPTHDEVLEAMSIQNTEKFDSIALHFPHTNGLPGHYLKESYLFSKAIYDRLGERLNEYEFIYAKGFTAWHILHEKQRGKKLPPVGVKFHGYEMFQKPPSFKARIQSYLLRGPVKWNSLQADYVFSYGGKISDIIRNLGVPDNRIIEIPTGIESTWLRETVNKSKELNFVFLGRYERRKGVDELNQALKEALNECDFKFHFIGPIPPSKRLLDKRIIYHGTVMDSEKVKEILDECQVLVAPSHSEGMPNVIMEGMARGLAILATPVGAIEAVVDKSNGWLVRPGDVADLKKTIVEIARQDQSILLAKQSASLVKIREFLWENIGRQTRGLIEKLR